jgi:hypothetical protein
MDFNDMIIGGPLHHHPTLQWALYGFFNSDLGYKLVEFSGV